MGTQKNRKPTIAPNASNVYEDVVGGGGGAGGLSKTTTEQDTGLTNIDGDPIYQVTKAIAAGPNNTIVSIPHGIVGLKKLERVFGYLDDGTTWRDVANLEASVAASMHWAVTATDFALQSGTGGDFSLFSGSVTLQYTKV